MKQKTNLAHLVAMNREDMMQLFGGSVINGTDTDSISIQDEDWKKRIRNHGGCVFF